MSPDYHWTIGPQLRRAIFLVLAFVWMFIWYHRQVIAFEDRQPPEPNMPLHHAALYVARQSKWAANSSASLDGHWITRVDAELISALRAGGLRAFGEYRPDAQNAEQGWREIPREFFDYAEWRSDRLGSDNPPSHMWRSSTRGGGMYLWVRLDRRQVESLWPRRSLWQRLRGKSPVDRWVKASAPLAANALRDGEKFYTEIRNSSIR